MANTNASTPVQWNWATKTVNTVSGALKWLYKVSLVANRVQMEKLDSPVMSKHTTATRATEKAPKEMRKTEPQSISQSQRQTQENSEDSFLYGSGTFLRLAEIEAEVMAHMDGVDFLIEGPRYELARQEFVERYE